MGKFPGSARHFQALLWICSGTNPIQDKRTLIVKDWNVVIRIGIISVLSFLKVLFSSLSTIQQQQQQVYSVLPFLYMPLYFYTVLYMWLSTIQPFISQPTV